MKTVDLLQVVYEHWAKPRDIEEKEILKSSIGSTLPTCIHCVICKSNNLFFFFFGVFLHQIAGGSCLKMNAFRMSGSWGHSWWGDDFFYIHSFMWKLGQVGQICFYSVVCVCSPRSICTWHLSVSGEKSHLFILFLFYPWQIWKRSLRYVTCRYGVC